MVLTLRSIHMKNTTSMGIAFVLVCQTMPDRKTTNSGVSAIDGGVEYYGIVEEIYELLYYGENPPNAVVFKCHWFDPKDTRRTHEHVGLCNTPGVTLQ